MANIVISDSNLKRDIELSDINSDASTLQRIMTYDYRMYQSVVPVKGFIAQQLEEVFPQCVKKYTGIIPSSVTVSFISKDGSMLQSSLPFDVELGEKIMIQNGQRTTEMVVYKKEEGKIYLSGDKTFFGIKIEVIGKNGFLRTLDTTQILALCVSTIKQLSDKVHELEQKLQ